MRPAKADTARSSFCHKAEDVVERLIPSPSDRNVRICDECLAVCNSILSDMDSPPVPRNLRTIRDIAECATRALPTLLNTIEQWAIAESQHRHSLVFLGRACRLALSMMGFDSA